MDLHIQTWTAMFRADIADQFKLHMLATCAPSIPWKDAIALSEIGASTHLLTSGYSLASLHPNFPLLTDHHRQALRYGITELREKLFDCTNPVQGKGGQALSKLDLSEVVFVKYGGEVLRQSLLVPLLCEKVTRNMREKFPESDFSAELPC
jgi:hypothetical protein